MITAPLPRLRPQYVCMFGNLSDKTKKGTRRVVASAHVDACACVHARSVAACVKPILATTTRTPFTLHMAKVTMTTSPSLPFSLETVT